MYKFHNIETNKSKRVMWVDMYDSRSDLESSGRGSSAFSTEESGCLRDFLERTSKHKVKQQTENVAFNLSSKSIPISTSKSMQRGLSFLATPYYHPSDSRVDIYKLIRLLNLKKFFSQTRLQEQSRFRTKSTFVPQMILQSSPLKG